MVRPDTCRRACRCHPGSVEDLIRPDVPTSCGRRCMAMRTGSATSSTWDTCPSGPVGMQRVSLSSGGVRSCKSVGHAARCPRERGGRRTAGPGFVPRIGEDDDEKKAIGERSPAPGVAAWWMETIRPFPDRLLPRVTSARRTAEQHDPDRGAGKRKASGSGVARTIIEMARQGSTGPRPGLDNGPRKSTGMWAA
jgi:hypothetical protein